MNLLEQSKIIKAISDPARLGVVKLCFDGNVYVEDMKEYFKIEPTLLSHHLKVLKDNGIVLSFRDGKRVFYKINPTIKLRGRFKGLKFESFKIIFNN